MSRCLSLLLALALAGLAEEKPAEQVYKNIQVLKGVPSSRVTPAMTFIAGSLGVTCDHCHTMNQLASDDKPAKQTARRMIQLMQAINREHYGGKNVVNCNTCHQGRLQPVSMPAIRPPDGAKPESSAPLPSVDDVFDRHVQALGGRPALEKVTTRAWKGFMEIPGRKIAIERHEKAPNRLLMTAQLPNGSSYVGYDGKAGWETNPSRNAGREMEGDALARIRWDAEFYRDLRFREMYTGLAVTGQEKIAGRPAWVVEGISREGNSERLYFDAEAGLLVRRLVITVSPLGPLPFAEDFEDYRQVEDVKIPFTLRWSRADMPLTFRFSEVQLNRPLEDEKFTKPRTNN